MPTSDNGFLTWWVAGTAAGVRKRGEERQSSNRERLARSRKCLILSETENHRRLGQRNGTDTEEHAPCPTHTEWEDGQHACPLLGWWWRGLREDGDCGRQGQLEDGQALGTSSL